MRCNYGTEYVCTSYERCKIKEIAIRCPNVPLATRKKIKEEYLRGMQEKMKMKEKKEE